VQKIVVILDIRWCAVGISWNPLKIWNNLSWVIFSTSSNISLCYMLDGGAEPEHTWTCSVRDLYHHVQQFYSTMLSHTANCCGRYKLIWTVSCISHNISHHLSSPPFNVKLSVWLPSSCNAAPLITKPTTQHKQVAVRQPITQYHILCCYPVSRPGLLDVQRLGEFVRGDREMWQLFFYNRHLTFSSVLQIYTYPVLPQLPKIKTCHSNSRTKWHWSGNSDTSDTCWSNESLELVNQ